MIISTVRKGPVSVIAQIFTTGSLAQLLPLPPCPRGRLKFAEDGRSHRVQQRHLTTKPATSTPASAFN
jgi:hypothetical protein